MNSLGISKEKDGEDDEEAAVQLPGFRFHPTDQELVGFYLQRKVEMKPLIMDLIKQIDIYKYDPWDLPKSNTVGDNEWYFFCKRGRKYKNSIRPNRVTGSGFWKATGIDKPVYSTITESDSGSANNDENHHRTCIGLKKSLVYYRGSAGKGTKTDWMMHEFRLPVVDDHEPTNLHISNSKLSSPHLQPEAEVWTLCRIFQRNMSYKMYNSNVLEDGKKHAPTHKQSPTEEAFSDTCSAESDDRSRYLEYISFETPSITFQDDHHLNQPMDNNGGDQLPVSHFNPANISIAPAASVPGSSFPINQSSMGFITYEGWDELRSVVDQSLPPFH